MSDPHGYVAYSHGCRCEVCRAAKADYMRERRKAKPLAQKLTASSTGRRPTNGTSRVPGATRYIAQGDITHGTRSAYDEHKCRCFPCTDARAASDRKYRKRAA